MIDKNENNEVNYKEYRPRKHRCKDVNVRSMQLL